MFFKLSFPEKRTSKTGNFFGLQNWVTNFCRNLRLSIFVQLNLTDKAEVLFQPPVFQKPLRPGEWTGLITADWQVIAQTKFLVLPSPTPTDNQGPEGNVYIDFNFTSVSKILSLRPEDKMIGVEENVRKSGGELERWIDELVEGFTR